MLKKTKGFIAAFFVVVATAVLHYENTLAYISGFLNSKLLYLLAVSFFPMVLLSAMCLAYQIYASFHYWKDADRNARAIYFTFIILSVIFLIGGIKSNISTPCYVRHTAGLYDRINSKELPGDINSIREWLVKLESSHGSYRSEIPLSDCPNFIIKLKPEMVQVDQTQKVLTLSWVVGHLGRWDLTIGPPNMETPQSSEEGLVRYILPIAPGLFISFSEW